MDAKQTKWTIGFILLVVLAWVISPLFGSRHEIPGNVDQIQPQFDAALAMQDTRDLVTGYPDRVIGSNEARRSTGFLQERFQELGYEVSYSHFNAVIAGRRQVGRNIYAYKAGQAPEILAVVAHYDTAGTTRQGAMDDGSGVGTMLELARLAAARPMRRSLLFVASDGEEWGMLGALDLVRHYPERSRIAAALSLDYVASGDLSRLTLDTTGQVAGYTPPWLRLMARGAAQAEGMPLAEPFGFEEHLQRALPFSRTDQGPFLYAGIPAINLGSASRDVSRELATYHSVQDIMENLKVESFGKLGRTAERLLRALDALPSIPQESMGYVRALNNIFLPPALIATLQILAFAPVLLLTCFHFFNHRRYLTPGRIQRELSCFLGTLFPFLLAFSTIYILARLHWLPRYSVYPATPRDPVLEHPAWGPLFGILAVILAGSACCYLLVKYLNRKLPRADFHVSKTVLLTLCLGVVFISLIYNAYWAVSFLVLPVWVWSLIGAGNGAGARAANRILIVSAGVLYFMVSCTYAEHLRLGWNMIWYQVLAVSTGAFTWQAYLLSVSSFAIGLRFFAIQSQSTGT